MFSFLDGVPRVVVPDNLKSAVLKADRYVLALGSYSPQVQTLLQRRMRRGIAGRVGD